MAAINLTPRELELMQAVMANCKVEVPSPSIRFHPSKDLP